MITFLCLLAILNLSENPVTFVEDSRVKSLVNRCTEYNKSAPINGFRINIYFQSGNNSRSRAYTTQIAFSERFPNIKSYVSFEEPYFRVNVGNFRTRLEAFATLEKLTSTYPQAYVVRDVLEVKDLLNAGSVSEDSND